MERLIWCTCGMFHKKVFKSILSADQHQRMLLSLLKCLKTIWDQSMISTWYLMFVVLINGLTTTMLMMDNLNLEHSLTMIWLQSTPRNLVTNIAGLTLSQWIHSEVKWLEHIWKIIIDNFNMDHLLHQVEKLFRFMSLIQLVIVFNSMVDQSITQRTRQSIVLPVSQMMDVQVRVIAKLKISSSLDDRGYYEF